MLSILSIGKFSVPIAYVVHIKMKTVYFIKCYSDNYMLWQLNAIMWKNQSNENQLNCLKYLATKKLQIKYINTNQPSSCCWIENVSVGDVCMHIGINYTWVL